MKAYEIRDEIVEEKRHRQYAEANADDGDDDD